MVHDTDKILLRAKDIGLLIGVVSLLGMFFGPLKKVFQMEETITKMAKLEDRVGGHDSSIAVINSQYADIQKQLEQMNWQLRRINNERR